MDTLDPPPSYSKQNFVVMPPASGPASAAAVPYPGQGPAPVPALVPVAQQVSPHEKFLKGQPKALGTVQIMIGIMTLLFGVVLTITQVSVVAYFGCTIWASLLYISAGAVTVAGANFQNSCVIKGSLVMNVISAVAAGISLFLLSTDVALGRFRIFNYYDSRSNTFFHNYYTASLEGQSQGISGVLLAFCLLQLFISIWISAFGCKSTCRSQPMSVYVVPNPNMTNAVVQYTPSAPVMYPQTVAV